MPRKVLIVEDDSNIAELLRLYLEKEDFETEVASDGGKGVELFRSFHPDLVLLDIMLPVMDGWSVLKKIRETDKTPVIMLTAKGETSDKVAGLEGARTTISSSPSRPRRSWPASTPSSAATAPRRAPASGSSPSTSW